MGNSSSKGPFEVSKATHALHTAITRWDLEAVKKELANGADAWAFRLVTKEEKVAIWAGGKPEVGTQYAVNAMGKFCSELHLRVCDADAHVSPPPFTPALLRDMFATLLHARGVDVNGIIERHGTDEKVSRGDARITDAFRMLIMTAGEGALRKKRAHLLYPLLAMLMDAGTLTCLTVDDLVVWSAVGVEPAVKRIAAQKDGLIITRDGARTDARKSALLAAVDLGLLSVVRALLEAGADPNVADSDGVTALMHCTGDWDPRSAEEVEESRRPTMGMVEVFLQRGADAHAKDNRGRTALHHFAGSRSAGLDSTARLFVCVRLLREGVSAHQKEYNGWTPLDWARERKDSLLHRAMKQEAAWLRRRALVIFHSKHAPPEAKLDRSSVA